MSEQKRIRILVCLAISLGIACITITSRAGRMEAIAERQKASAFASAPARNLTRKFWHKTYTERSTLPTQGPLVDKPVDQTRKNIQVLKGLPESQLFPLMNFVASSLGVQCGFCHMQQGKDPKTGFTNWIWDNDDKPEKQTARRMMRMVLSVNATNKVDFTDN